MTKKKLQKELKRQIELSNDIVAENYYLHKTLNDTEQHLQLAESELQRKEVIIKYLEIRNVELINGDE